MEAFQARPERQPSGRPKKIKSLKTEIIEELDELTSVTEEGHKRQVSKARAIAKAIVREAANGNMRATTAMMSLFAATLSTPSRQTIQVPRNERCWTTTSNAKFDAAPTSPHPTTSTSTIRERG